MQAAEVHQLLAGRHRRVQAAFLRHVAPPLPVLRGDPVPVPLQLAGIRHQDTEQDPQQRGLSRTVRPEQTGEHTGRDVDAHPGQGTAVPEGMTDTADLQGSRRSR